MSLFANLFVNGVILGLLYATIALGFSLVLGVSGVLNFAHGVLFTLGAYSYWVLKDIVGFWPALGGATLIVGVIGIAVERLLVRRVYGEDPLFGLVITMGFAMAIEQVLHMIFGAAAKTVNPPEFAQGVLFLGDMMVPYYRLFVAACCVVALAGTWLVLNNTTFGAVVRAGMYDSEMVSALGHDLPRMRTVVFTLGTMAAAFSGVLASSIWSIKPGMGGAFLMPSFLIVLIGGLGSIRGTILGGLIVGLTTSLLSLVIPRFVDIMPYAIMAVVVYFWPRGLLGKQNILE